MQNSIYYFIKHQLLKLFYILTLSKMKLLKTKDLLTGKDISKYNKIFYNIHLNYVSEKCDLYFKQYDK